MPSCTRRSILSSLLGGSLFFGVHPTQAQIQSQSPFKPVWMQRLIESAGFTDSDTLTDGTIAVALDNQSSEGVASPNVAGFDDDGTQKWTWDWPEDRSNPLDHVQALVSTGDGGLFFAGPTDRDPPVELLIGKLDAERNIEWHITHEQYLYRDLFLIRPGPSWLTAVGFHVTPSISRTDVFGVDTDAQSVVWETDTFSNGETSSATFHQQGCVVAGDVPDGGRVARVTPEGNVTWERTFSEPKLELTDATVSPANNIVAIGYRINEPETAEILTLDPDGALKQRRPLQFHPLSSFDEPRIVSSPVGGYVCALSYSDRPELFVGKLTSNRDIASSTHVEPWDSDFRPVLLDIQIADGDPVLLGDIAEGGPASAPTWGLKIAKSTSTPSPTTPSQTPRPTETEPSDPLRTSSPTGVPTETRRPRATTPEQSPTNTVSVGGPGFGALAGVLGTLGAGLLTLLWSTDKGER